MIRDNSDQSRARAGPQVEPSLDAGVGTVQTRRLPLVAGRAEATSGLRLAGPSSEHSFS